MPSDGDDISQAEMRRWMARLEVQMGAMTARMDALPYVRLDVYAADRLAVNNSIQANRQYVDAEVRDVTQAVTNVSSDLKAFRAAATRAVWGLVSAASIIGGGAFALFHH